MGARVLPDAFPFLFPRDSSIDPLRNSTLVGIGTTAGAAVALPGPASDALWSKCRCKGQMLTHGMIRSDKDAGKMFDPPLDTVQSRFRDFPMEFQRWHYTFRGSSSGPDMTDFGAWGVQPALRSLGVSDQSTDRGGRNKITRLEHWNPRAQDEDGYPIPLEDQTYTVRLDNGRVVELPVSIQSSVCRVLLMLT